MNADKRRELVSLLLLGGSVHMRAPGDQLTARCLLRRPRAALETSDGALEDRGRETVHVEVTIKIADLAMRLAEAAAVNNHGRSSLLAGTLQARLLERVTEDA